MKIYHGTNNFLKADREAKEKQSMFKTDIKAAGKFDERQVDHKQFQKHLNESNIPHLRKKKLCDQMNQYFNNKSPSYSVDISKFYKDYEDKKPDDPEEAKKNARSLKNIMKRR